MKQPKRALWSATTCTISGVAPPCSHISIHVVGRPSGEQSSRASKGIMGLMCRLKRWKAFKHVSSVNQAATVRAVGSSQPANLGQQLPTNAPDRQTQSIAQHTGHSAAGAQQAMCAHQACCAHEECRRCNQAPLSACRDTRSKLYGPSSVAV
jgi:hypothetical protein